MIIPTNFFFIDLLKIFPDDITCYIQAPSLENAVIKDLLKDSDYDQNKYLQFDKSIKNIIIRQEIETSFSKYLNRMQIRINGILVFEGFDGIEYGVISQKVNIPKWFADLYVPDTCMISSKW